jgi:hypothetical protein
MPSCPALKRDGVVCGKNGNFFENHCGTHFNSKYAKDPVFRARCEAAAAEANAAATVAAEAREQLRQTHAADRLVLQEAARQERVRIRTEKLERNQRRLGEVENLSSYEIMLYAQRLMYIWKHENIPGYNCVKAYACLKYMTVRHAGFLPLIRAVMAIYFQTSGHHPDHDIYTNVPIAERQEALNNMATALTPYGEVDYRTLIVVTDKYHTDIQRRIRAEAEAIAAAEAADAIAAAARAAAARHAQLMEDLRERPVVFNRDPEGSIDLAAFGRDHQNVHRSSVQKATEEAVRVLITRPLVEGQDTLPEVIAAFSNTRIVRFSSTETRDFVITELTNDYYITEAFSIMYGLVLDHVWAYIREHIEKKELIVRLAQEVVEGLSQCGNGKMARLVNVLVGYDDTLQFPVPTRELFMERISLLSRSPMAQRESQARSLFEEFSIPAEEHASWLEPLLEEADPQAASDSDMPQLIPA